MPTRLWWDDTRGRRWNLPRRAGACRFRALRVAKNPSELRLYLCALWLTTTRCFSCALSNHGGTHVPGMSHAHKLYIDVPTFEKARPNRMCSGTYGYCVRSRSVIGIPAISVCGSSNNQCFKPRHSTATPPLRQGRRHGTAWKPGACRTASSASRRPPQSPPTLRAGGSASNAVGWWGR